ncbi:hypothetical protein QR46_0463 [Giardia duodenalis assemblage B]|uniref:Uncharacterized protein n=3 Tax=Giardia intestinalis TaxID=5741 RepID=A0A132NZH6_GIAIN|nr:Hypothetical protein GL50581_362 [Giardia intestinalis ATCC 50581]ESU45368.1 Hypothetical protein GSB_150085 [Giardia intestinalis]KWX15479.1 hypothetical protein QR46_0463 [Giardia intestinalis assemblage B]
MDLPLPSEVAPFPQAQADSLRFCSPKLLPIVSPSVIRAEAANQSK